MECVATERTPFARSLHAPPIEHVPHHRPRGLAYNCWRSPVHPRYSGRHVSIRRDIHTSLHGLRCGRPVRLCGVVCVLPYVATEPTPLARQLAHARATGHKARPASPFGRRRIATLGCRRCRPARVVHRKNHRREGSGAIRGGNGRSSFDPHNGPHTGIYFEVVVVSLSLSH